MQNPTKYCELQIVMKTGERMNGIFHVPIGTEPNTRPADAIRTLKGEYLLLCDATIESNSGTNVQQAVLVRCDAVSYITLPPQEWSVRDVAYDDSTSRDSFRSN